MDKFIFLGCVLVSGVAVAIAMGSWEVIAGTALGVFFISIS